MEDLNKGGKWDTIEGEDDGLLVNVNEAANDVALFPPWQLGLTLAGCVEPHQLPAPVVSLAEFVVSYAVALVVQELGLFRCPSKKFP